MNAQKITLRRPDDWHVHLRDGEVLRRVAPYTARHFSRAVVMPNLVPPVTTSAAATAYRQRVLEAAADPEFEPLMAVYLTDNSDGNDIVSGFEAGAVFGAKLYPAGATTNADRGVTNISNISNVLAQMQSAGMPLMIHGEVVGDQYDVFDREAVFIDEVLTPLCKRFPELPIVLEHITTQQAVDFIRQASDKVAGTITPHHLMINRTTMFRGGIRPHFYCLPVAKREQHRLAVREAATSGEAKFFLGTDSAPHPENDKQNACGCAGIFNAPTALGCYAQVFDEENALENFEAFAALNGPAFYNREPNKERITLVRREQPIDPISPIGNEKIHVFYPDLPLTWQIASDD